MARDLEDAPYTYVRLHLALDPMRTPTEKVSGSRTPPLPLRLAILSAATTYADVLGAWELAVVNDEGLTLPGRWVRESFAVQRAVRMLAPRMAAACRLAPELAVGLHTTTGVARRLLGLTRVVHRLDPPCPGCGEFGLRREDGVPLVRCIQCGAGWAEGLYERLVYVLASEYGSTDGRH